MLKLASGSRPRRLLTMVIAIVLALVAVLLATGSAAATGQKAHFDARLAVLDSELQRARAAGYTSEDVQPVTSARQELSSRPEPFWVGQLGSYYATQAEAVDRLTAELKRVEADLLDQQRAAADSRLADASSQIQEDQKLGADDSEIAALNQRADQVAKARAAATTIGALRAVAKDAEAVQAEAADDAAAQKAELAAIKQAGDLLKQQAQGDVARIEKAGQDALAAGRNDVTAATWLRETGFDRPYSQLEKQAAGLSASDVDQAAFAAAAAQRYAAQIHDALLKGMPKKAILISMQGQQLWAYESSKVVADTLVTSGRPPDLATDVGPMKVLWKQSPWKMHSPWPPGSPYWYPDTVVQMVVWFTNTGEGLHDAYWQSTPYGPGSQYGPSASHGCVHVPYSTRPSSTTGRRRARR